MPVYRRTSILFIGIFVACVFLLHKVWQPSRSISTLPYTSESPVLPAYTTVSHHEIDALIEEQQNIIGSDARLDDIVPHNRKVLYDLADCLRSGTCTRNQTKLIILDAPSFASAFDGASEEYYAQSALRAMKAFNLPHVYSSGNPLWAAKVHALFPENVHSVLLESAVVTKCFKETTWGCAATLNHTSGIPASKIFSWDTGETFDRGPSILGPKWTLAAAPFSGGQTYIGYDFEEACAKQPFVPHHKRKNRAWIFVNLETYFYVRHNIFPHQYFERAGNATGMGFVAALEPHEGRLSIEKYGDLIRGIVSVPSNMEELNRSEMSGHDLRTAVSESKLLIGLLDPKELSLPYEALCMGLPFINPIHQWDHSNKQDRSKWVVENAILKYLEPPYVYNVFLGDEPAFLTAIRGSLANPIERYLPPDMSRQAFEARFSAFLEHDWKAEAGLQTGNNKVRRSASNRQLSNVVG